MVDIKLIPQLFGDDPQKPILNYSRFDLDTLKNEIKITGFGIAKGLVPTDTIEIIRNFWINKFTQSKPSERVTWGPSLGNPNTIGYSDDAFQKLYRACDFLWNDAQHAETRAVCLHTHALRNLILDQDPLVGLKFTDSRYGIFVTASYYPSESGFMAPHNDGVGGQNPLVHSLIPITFYKRDYQAGGMKVVSRSGQEVHVDAMVEPGDVVFYDGALRHGVDKIVPFPGKNLGRLQIFPIPTQFKNLENNPLAIARIPLKTFLQAKSLVAKNKIRVMLGRESSIR